MEWLKLQEVNSERSIFYRNISFLVSINALLVQNNAIFVGLKKKSVSQFKYTHTNLYTGMQMNVN